MGITSPSVLAAPPTQALSKAPLFCPAPALRPTGTRSLPSAPSWAESSFTGTHWSSPQAELQADFQPHRPLGTCPATDSHARTSVGGRRGGTEDIPTHGHPHTLPASSREDDHFPLVSREESSRRKDTQHRLVWRGRCRQTAPAAGLSVSPLPSLSVRTSEDRDVHQHYRATWTRGLQCREVCTGLAW